MTHGFSETQMSILVVAIYATIAIFLFQLSFSCYNVWKFLICQKKYKTTPLLAFYVFVGILSTNRLIWTIMYFHYYLNLSILDQFIPITKIDMGLV